MKSASVAILCLLSSVLAFGQVDWSDSFVEEHCGGAVISEGPHAEKVKQIAQLLDTGDLGLQTYLIDRNVINAWVVPADRTHSLVCIPIGLVYWLRKADGELTFVMAHEYGHTMDESCATREGRAKLATKSRSPFAVLFGTSSGNESGDSRKCELRADAVAFMLMTQSGANPDDAIAALKRLQAVSHDRRNGTMGRLLAMNDSHPILSDRIKQMERLRKSFRRAHRAP